MINIAIDGPAGSGKTTVAKQISKMLDEMRREGNKGVLKIGRAVRINVDAFQKFLERKTEEANELQGKISN